MEPTQKQQAIARITAANRVLIVPGRPDGDSVGSALALLLMMKKLGKEVGAVTMDTVSESYKFLPSFSDVRSDLVGLRDFIISLNSQNVEPEKLSYNVAEGRLNIVITPKEGSYSANDVTFSEGSMKYDLIITLDSPSLEMLGNIHSTHPEIFTEIPIVNIDHHATNKHFGAVNLVDITATSTGEILVGLAEALGVEFDADIATCLLTGIIADTGSFQHANTTPKSLTVAAQMVGFGARQQEIIKHLFKTKSLATLKLWGQILSKIQHDIELRLVWSYADLDTITTTGASGEDIAGLIDELMTSVPGADIVILITEREPNMINGSIRTSRGVDASAIAGLMGGGGHPGAAGFKLINTSLEDAKQTILGKVRDFRNQASDQPAPQTPLSV